MSDRVQAQPLPLPSRLPAGTFQLVGLEYIRKSLESNWDEHRDAVHAVVESVFRRYLKPIDAYYKIDPEHFLVLFTHLPLPQVEAKAEGIARQSERLLADILPPGHDTTVMSRIAEVDRSILMEKVRSLDSLLDYIKFGTLIVDDDTDDAAASTNHASMFDTFEDVRAAQPAAAAAVGAGPDMADFDQSLSSLFQKKTSAVYLKECSTSFEPIFDTKRKSFTGFRVMVMRQDAPALAEEDPFIENPDELRFYIDRYALLSAALGLQRSVAQGNKGLIVIPVHFDTLAVSKTRNVYMQRLREVPSGYIPFIGFAIVGLPVGTPAGRVADVVSFIQPLSHWQSVEILPEPRWIDIYSSSNCKAVATSARPLEGASPKQTEDLFAVARRARAAQIESILSHVGDKEALHFGLSAGFSQLIGPAVAASCKTPEPFDRIAKPV